MIVSENIPFTAKTFLQRCTEDVMNGRIAPTPDSYLSFLEAETEKRPRYRPLLNYLKVLDRSTGEPRYCADADHIIPIEVWGILMFGFLEPGQCGRSFNVLTNLFWRDRQWNRGIDQQAIKIISIEAPTKRLNSQEGFAWRQEWIERFLRTKRKGNSSGG
jgi:hypothetical protein